MKPIVKVCGMRYPENIQAILAHKPDWMGFIFYNQSPRFLSKIPKNINFSNTKKVGVFVNASKEEILQNVVENKLDIVQLHGNESPTFCNNLKDDVQVMKAIRVQSKEDVLLAQQYENTVHYFVFDTKRNTAFGGTGEQFNWSILQGVPIPHPFLLSGGISIKDEDKLKQFSHPMLLGYDINSKFEREHGIKHPNQVQQFIQTIQT